MLKMFVMVDLADGGNYFFLFFHSFGHLNNRE